MMIMLMMVVWKLLMMIMMVVLMMKLMTARKKHDDNDEEGDDDHDQDDLKMMMMMMMMMVRRRVRKRCMRARSEAMPEDAFRREALTICFSILAVLLHLSASMVVFKSRSPCYDHQAAGAFKQVVPLDKPSRPPTASAKIVKLTSVCFKRTAHGGSTWYTIQSGNSWARQTIYLSVCLSACLSVYLYLCAYLPKYLPIYLSIYQPISVYQH